MPGASGFIPTLTPIGGLAWYPGSMALASFDPGRLRPSILPAMAGKPRAAGLLGDMLLAPDALFCFFSSVAEMGEASFLRRFVLDLVSPVVGPATAGGACFVSSGSLTRFFFALAGFFASPLAPSKPETAGGPVSSESCKRPLRQLRRKSRREKLVVRKTIHTLA